MKLVPYSRKSGNWLWLSFALLLSLSFAIGACRTATTLEPDSNTGPTVKTTIAGVTVDPAGMPLANVTISAHGQTTTSNEHGYFVIPDVMVPKDRAHVLAKQDGYFPSSRAASATENGLTEVKLYMMPYGNRTLVSAVNGGVIHVTGTSGTASVRFQPNGMTVSGQPYSGEARVAVRYLDPAEANFSNFFPGDEAAIRESGDNTMLVSYGVLRVDMRTPSGEVIQPAPGKPAELTYPIPSTLTNPPASIPLWFFDEERGLWVEEGVSTKQGNNYVGTVKHFTSWNCDKPEGTARIVGKVTCNGRGISGVVVRIGQVVVVSGKGGLFGRRVPANTEFDVEVQLDQNDGLYGSEAIDVAAIPEGQEVTVDIPLTTDCPATITGTLLNSSGTKIPGTVTWVRDNGKVYAGTALEGAFEMSVPPGSQMELAMSSWACDVKKTYSVQAGDKDSKTDLGPFVICSDEPTEGDIDISSFGSLNGTRAVLSPDGKFVALTGGQVPVSVVRNATTGQFISSTPILSDSGGWIHTAQFSPDGSKYIVGGVYFRAAVTYKLTIIETTTGKILSEIENADSAVFFADGQSVLVTQWVDGGTRRNLVKYSIETGTVEETFDRTGIPDDAYLIGMSPSGEKALLRSDKTIYTYDLVGEKKESEITVASLGYYFLTLSSDATKLASYEYSTNQIVVIDLSSGSKVNVTDLKIGKEDYDCFAFHPNSKDILFQPIDGGKLSSPSMIDFATGEIAKSLSIPDKTTDFGHFSISADGTRASGVYLDGQKLLLRVWDL